MNQKKKERLLFYEAIGFSMWPLLKGKERLIVNPVPPAELIPGDLILYRMENQVICHRLIKKKKEENKYMLYARADTSLSVPELVKEEVFLGRVIGLIKANKVTYFDTARQKFVNRMMLVVSPLIGMFLKTYNFFVRR